MLHCWWCFRNTQVKLLVQPNFYWNPIPNLLVYQTYCFAVVSYFHCLMPMNKRFPFFSLYSDSIPILLFSFTLNTKPISFHSLSSHTYEHVRFLWLQSLLIQVHSVPDTFLAPTFLNTSNSWYYCSFLYLKLPGVLFSSKSIAASLPVMNSKMETTEQRTLSNSDATVLTTSPFPTTLLRWIFPFFLHS